MKVEAAFLNAASRLNSGSADLRPTPIEAGKLITKPITEIRDIFQVVDSIGRSGRI